MLKALFIEQVRQGRPITITDPAMTRFMMSLDQAVDLVLFAFKNGVNGDIFVQKAPAATIDLLAKTIRNLLACPDHLIKTIGMRHGEKLYESLLTSEEMAKAVEMDNYYRIPADVRDLNYEEYYQQGDMTLSNRLEYNSHTTYQLNGNELTDMLLNTRELAVEFNKAGVSM